MPGPAPGAVLLVWNNWIVFIRDDVTGFLNILLKKVESVLVLFDILSAWPFSPHTYPKNGRALFSAVPDRFFYELFVPRLG
jgi:hypothetical protein